MKPTLIYDDTCELCNSFINYMKSKYKDIGEKIEIQPLTQVDNLYDSHKINNEDLKKSVHFVLEDGKVLTKTNAIIEVIRVTGISSPVLSFANSPMLRILNFFYDVVAYYRKSFIVKWISRVSFKMLK